MNAMQYWTFLKYLPLYCVTVEQQVTTKERFLLLDNDDLKELGFLMGPRKQLVH